MSDLPDWIKQLPDGYRQMTEAIWNQRRGPNLHLVSSARYRRIRQLMASGMSEGEALYASYLAPVEKPNT